MVRLVILTGIIVDKLRYATKKSRLIKYGQVPQKSSRQEGRILTNITPAWKKSGEPIESLGILKYKARIIMLDQKALIPSDIDSFIKLPV